MWTEPSGETKKNRLNGYPLPICRRTRSMKYLSLRMSLAQSEGIIGCRSYSTSHAQ